jgi:hypothetical protein
VRVLAEGDAALISTKEAAFFAVLYIEWVFDIDK